MIFVGFLLISGIFYMYAHFAGGARYFFNPDSYLVSLAAAVLFSLCTFKGRAFARGVACMLRLGPKGCEKDPEVRDLFFALIFVSLAAGICSTFQGMICGILLGKALPPSERIALSEMFCYASFSTVYGLMYSAFLFYPVFLVNKKA